MTEMTCSVLAPIVAMEFGECPICYASSPLTDEHVPQHELGGKIVTKTCDDCNNKHGSRTEVWLARWYDDVFPDPAFSHPGVRGERKAGPTAYRTTSDGNFVIVTRALMHPAVRERALHTRQFAFSYGDPREDRWRIAALKHAYLAACLNLKDIPKSPDADEIRHDLLVARDFDNRARLPESRIAPRLIVARSLQRQLDVPDLAVVAAQVGNEPIRRFMIIMAGLIAVSWPFVDIRPRLS